MRGKAFKFGDNISTDHIAPGRLFHLRSDLQEFSKHVLEDADENFAKNMKKGDFVVAVFPGLDESLLIKIMKVGYKQFKSLTLEDAKLEGFDSLADLKNELLKIYPI